MTKRKKMGPARYMVMVPVIEKTDGSDRYEAGDVSDLTEYSREVIEAWLKKTVIAVVVDEVVVVDEEVENGNGSNE